MMTEPFRPVDMIGKLRRYCRLHSPLARNLLCEFFGTALMLFMGFNVTAQTVLTKSAMNSSIGLSLGWGFSLMFAVQMGYRISGSHFNPAVTLFVWSFGQLPFMHVIWYSIVQTLGAFFGAFLTFTYYYEKIKDFDGGFRAVVGDNSTAGIFATYPGEHLSMVGGVFDQIVCTALLCIIIGVITDERNHIPKWAHPSLFGLMLTTICLSCGLNAGNAMNPARDFGPRLFTYLAGYGHEVFSYRDYMWFWIPIVCPMIGALIGAWLYQLIIGIQQGSDDEFEHLPLASDGSNTPVSGGSGGGTAERRNDSQSDLLKTTRHSSFILIK